MTSAELRQAVADSGGLMSASDLARRWRVSRARAAELVRMDDFPEPVGHVGERPVWLFDEVDDWRERRRNGET